MILKNRFQRINNHLISKKHLKESPNISGNVKWSNPEAMKFSDASNSKREVLSRLYYDVRERFNKYNRRKK